MATEHVRIDYDATKQKTDLKSTSGDPWQDLGILLQGLALCMAANVDKRKLDPQHLLAYVQKEIDLIAQTKKSYTVKKHEKKPPLLLLR